MTSPVKQTLLGQRNTNSTLSFKPGTTAGIKGCLFEIRLALFYAIKGLLNNYESFHLACNLPESVVGKLDDVVFLYETNDGAKRGLFVQAKNVNGPGISLASLGDPGKKANFSLIKYYHSYKRIVASAEQQIHFPRDPHVVLLTNQGIQKRNHLNELVTEKTLESDSPLVACGNHYQLKRNIVNKIDLGGISEDEFVTFLDRFVLAVNQPDETNLEALIKQELAKVMPLSSKNVGDVYGQLHQNIVEWYTNPNEKEWLSRNQISHWIATASDQDVRLVNPLTVPRSLPDSEYPGWKELKGKAKRYFLEKNVLFQNVEMPLIALVTADDLTRIEEETGSRCLVKELNRSSVVRVGIEPKWTIGYDPKYYVPRTIRVPVVGEESLNKWDEKHGEYVETSESSCRYPALRIESREKLLCKRSDIYDTFEMSEDDLVCQNRRVIIISDAPGTGKSTILASFYRKIKQFHPTKWVVVVDLSDLDVKAILETETVKQVPLKEVISMLLGLETRLEKLVLEHRMNHNGGLVLMFDAFDETGPKCQETVIELIKKLAETRVDQLYITTRPHLEENLENELKCSSLTFHPFSKDDQINLLTSYWIRSGEKSGDGDETRLRSEAETLLEKLNHSTWNEREDLCGVPLQCRMLAEAYESRLMTGISDQKHLDLAKLYESFVNYKMDIYFHSKEKIPEKVSKHIKESFKRDIVALYTKKASQLMFPGLLSPRTDLVSDMSMKNLLQVGLTYGSDHRFIHQTFAEYFAAMWLIDMLKAGRHVDFFMTFVCNGHEFAVVRLFVNRFIDDSTKVKVPAGFQCSFDTLKTCLLRPSEEGLHLVVELLLHFIGQLDFQKATNQVRENLMHRVSPSRLASEILRTESWNGMAAIHYAARSGNEKTVRLLLDFSRHLDIGSDVLKDKDLLGRTALHLAADKGHTKAVEILLNAATQLQIFLETLRDKDGLGLTALHYAARSGRDETVKFLGNLASNLGVDSVMLQDKNCDGMTAFHLAVREGKEATVELLQLCFDSN